MAEKTKGATSEVLRKITIKAIMGGNPDIEALLKLADKREELCSIYGIIRRFKPDQGEDGKAFIRFYGQIKGVNLKTGEVFEAGQCILPGMAQDQIYGAMGGGADGGGNDVQFGIKIGVKYDKSAVTKYVYTCESLMPPSDNDPLKLLENQLGASLKALPAPAKK